MPEVKWVNNNLKCEWMRCSLKTMKWCTYKLHIACGQQRNLILWIAVSSYKKTWWNRLSPTPSMHIENRYKSQMGEGVLRIKPTTWLYMFIEYDAFWLRVYIKVEYQWKTVNHFSKSIHDIRVFYRWVAKYQLAPMIEQKLINISNSSKWNSLGW